MAAEQDLIELNKGSRAWSDWRTSGHRPDLSGQDLSGKDLSGFDLSHCNLRGARLVRANLRSANFNGADLTGAELQDASGEGAYFRAATLIDACLMSSRFPGADFRRANFTRARLNRCDLTGASLERAVLVEAALAGAKLGDADLCGADLRGAHDFILDRNRIRNTQLPIFSSDLWSVLKRTYTGPRFALNLLLLLAFFAPFIGRTALWLAVAEYQPLIVREREQVRDWLVDRLPESRRMEFDARLNVLTPCLAAHCEDRRIWEVLLGMERTRGMFLLGIVLLTYNVLRLALTVWVGLLRDEEERSGFSPAGSHYLLLKVPHLAVQAMMYVAIASFAFSAWDWLNRAVSVPRADAGVYRSSEVSPVSRPMSSSATGPMISAGFPMSNGYEGQPSLSSQCILPG